MPGREGRVRPNRMDSLCLFAVRAERERHKDAVDATALRRATKNIWTMQATNFVRWLDNDFQPGVCRAKS